MSRIVGIVMVRNEDLHLRWVLQNIVGFCDEILLFDNNSTDKTWFAAKCFAERFKKVKVEKIADPADSHRAIEPLVGTPTWVFGVDGDEIYDPRGLAIFRGHLLAGRYDAYWRLYGNVLNCTGIDRHRGVARGYLAPPARPMTKLYNLRHVELWTGCSQRLHDGQLVFNKRFGQDRAFLRLCDQVDWEDALLRCLHLVFMRRSSKQILNRPRFSTSDRIRERLARRYLKTWISFWIQQATARMRNRVDKTAAYKRGELVEKPIDAFFSGAMQETR